MFARTICTLAVTLAAAGNVSAHDFWIKPTEFNTGVPGQIGVALEIGHPGEAEPYTRNPARIEKFVICGPGEKGPIRSIDGAPGAHPAGVAGLAQPGLYVIAYDSNHARSELQPAKFKSYLTEEGLEEIIETREAMGQSDKPGREIYSRCAKALVRASADKVRPAPDVQGATRVIGMPLEFVPVSDPTVARIGERVTLRLLSEGEPYTGALVEVTDELGHDHAADGSHTPHFRGRTDSKGEVTFVVDGPGMWVASAVVMEEAPASSNAEWESWWASLSFEVRAN